MGCLGLDLLSSLCLLLLLQLLLQSFLFTVGGGILQLPLSSGFGFDCLLRLALLLTDDGFCLLFLALPFFGFSLLLMRMGCLGLDLLSSLCLLLVAGCLGLLQ